MTKDQVHKRNNNSYFVATEHIPEADEISEGIAQGFALATQYGIQ